MDEFKSLELMILSKVKKSEEKKSRLDGMGSEE